MSQLTVTFHGVRGSLPAPGPETASVGGNTPCVEVRAGDTHLILDAGSGLRSLGDRLAQTMPVAPVILLSHLHWDHIMGLPFFVPLYVPGNRITILSGPNGSMPLEQALRQLMKPPFFPVDYQQVAPQLQVDEVSPGERFVIGEASIQLARLNHPDPVYAYRIDYAGRSVVYATDTEHFSCIDPTLKKLAQGADLLIYDAQYTPAEYRGEQGPAKVGWGHSTFEAATDLAQSADVKQLALFHHDPRRTDGAVAEIERQAQERFANTFAARESTSIVLDAEPKKDQRAA